MISVKFNSFNEFISSILPKPTKKYYTNTQLLLEFTIDSNKEDFLGEYIRYLTQKDIYTFLITQEGNSSFYLKDFSDFHVICVELTVQESAVTNYEFKKFGQIPFNVSKILFSINSVLNELGREKTVLIIFDSLTDIILWLDFNTAYKFMRKAVSYLRSSYNVSSLFLINLKSHSEQILSAFESLFDGVLISDDINECRVKGTIKHRYLPH